MYSLPQLKADLNEKEIAWIETDLHGRIRETNPAFFDLCGWAFEEINGRKPKDFLRGPLSESGQIELLSSYLWNRLPISTRLTNYHKNGSSYEVHMSIFPILGKMEKQKHEGFFAVEFNVTGKRDLPREDRKTLFEAARILLRREPTHNPFEAKV